MTNIILILIFIQFEKDIKDAFFWPDK